MKKQKMKLYEKILIGVLVILIIVFVIIAWRYNILVNIQKENSINLSKTNYYYRLENSDTITECWKKGGIAKINMKQLNIGGDTTFWSDSNTGEGYVFYNTTKEYTESNGGILGSRPTSLTTSYDDFNKFMLAINPTIYIGFKDYEGKECYYIKIGEQEELVEKATGLLLNTRYDDNERKLTYSFDTVTDSDVQKPDISEYTLQKSSNELVED